MLCAGITLYSPLKTWGAKAGMKVGIMGLGGLGHMGVKFAHAMGADHFVVTKDVALLKPLHSTFDLILNTVSADLDINMYIDLLKLDGTLVVIGLPINPYTLKPGALLSGRRRIAGSMIGGMPQSQEMLDFCGIHSIVSDVEVISADYVDTAYERTVSSDVKYRFVIDATTI